MLLDGIHVPLPTPFYRDGELYLRKLEHNVARYSLGPVHGLVALGPGSEAHALSDEECREVMRAVSGAAARDKMLVAGVSRDSVRGAVALAEEAELANFDVVMLSAPRSWPELVHEGGEQALRFFMQAVADRSPLPVALWSGIGTGAFVLSPEMIAELSSHSNVIGMYDAGLDEARLSAIAASTQAVQHSVTVTTVFTPVPRRMLAGQGKGSATFVSADALGTSGAAVAVPAPQPAVRTRTKTVGFQVLAAGSTARSTQLLEAGGAGMMPRLAACAPQGCHEVLAAFKDGDRELSVLKADRLTGADALMQDLGIAGVKYACDLNGYFGGAPRLPRLPLTADQKAQVEAVLRELKN